ncbi:MAG TPA: hypothetical protein VG102_02635 [Candidatus Paceibacterota bacterium]|jgi:antitoxin component of MazEF toxin-antitoxin module|nr:hypothetical protein [Candidatus Paceibacterota bacterium]
MSQKIIKVGSSAAVTLSPDTLEAVKLSVGDTIDVSFHPSSRTITMRPHAHAAGVNPDVVTWTNAFIDKNRKLLERLAAK